MACFVSLPHSLIAFDLGQVYSQGQDIQSMGCVHIQNQTLKWNDLQFISAPACCGRQAVLRARERERQCVFQKQQTPEEREALYKGLNIPHNKIMHHTFELSHLFCRLLKTG